MKDLIEALGIFAKYRNSKYPTHCEHDVLVVVDITQDEVSAADQSRLDELGFHWSSKDERWQSFRYGSA